MDAQTKRQLKECYTACQYMGGDAHKEWSLRMLSLVPQPRAERNFIEALHAVFSWAKDIWVNDMSTVSPQLGLSMSRDVATTAIGSAWWAHLGFPSFNLTLDFFRAIAVTDFGDHSDTPLNLPFPAMMVRFPEPLGECGSKGLFIHPALGGHENGDYPFYARRMSMCVSDMGRQSYSQWKEGIPINELLNGEAAHLDEINPVERAAAKELGHTVQHSDLALSRRVLGNMILYINESTKGVLPTERSHGGLHPEAVEREHKSKPFFRVGRPIKLTGQTRVALAHGIGSKSWKASQRWIVRGHWRNQAHGPQYSLHKKVWIQPHFRGPESMTEILEKTYAVE